MYSTVRSMWDTETLKALYASCHWKDGHAASELIQREEFAFSFCTTSAILSVAGRAINTWQWSCQPPTANGFTPIFRLIPAMYCQRRGWISSGMLRVLPFVLKMICRRQQTYVCCMARIVAPVPSLTGLVVCLER